MSQATEKILEQLEQLPIEVRPMFHEMAMFEACDDYQLEKMIGTFVSDFKEPLATLEKRAFDEGFKAAMKRIPNTKLSNTYFCLELEDDDDFILPTDVKCEYNFSVYDYEKIKAIILRAKESTSKPFESSKCHLEDWKRVCDYFLEMLNEFHTNKDVDRTYCDIRSGGNRNIKLQTCKIPVFDDCPVLD